MRGWSHVAHLAMTTHRVDWGTTQDLSGRHRGIASLVFSHRGGASQRISAARTRIARIFASHRIAFSVFSTVSTHIASLPASRDMGHSAQDSGLHLEGGGETDSQRCHGTARNSLPPWNLAIFSRFLVDFLTTSHKEAKEKGRGSSGAK